MNTSIQHENLEYLSGQGRKIFWAFVLITIAIVTFRGPAFASLPWNISNDNAMRLVEVRDWLSGQTWHDITQYRLDFEGVFMHWSRVVDVPIAALILLFSTLLPLEAAEVVAIIIWPLFLIIPTLWAMHRAGVWLGGPMGGVFGLILSMISIIIGGKYSPGVIDHHNLQLMLVAYILLGIASPFHTLTKGMLIGFSGALSLVVGLEAIPFIAFVSLSMGVIWLWQGGIAKPETIGFSTSFGAVFIAAFAILRPDVSTSTFQCDAFDAGLAIIGVGGASGLLLLAVFASDLPRTVRLLGIMVLGGAVIAIASQFAPGCLTNPYAQLHPIVISEWLDKITEAQPLLADIIHRHGVSFGAAVVPVLAIVFCFILAQDPERKTQAIVLGFAITIVYALTFYQIRGQAVLLLICVLPISAMLGKLYAQYKTTQSGRAGILVILLLLFSVPDIWSQGYGVLVPRQAVTPASVYAATNPLNTCFTPEALATLNAQPTGLVAASTDMGAGLLSGTSHSVVAANFHRNHNGIKAMLELAFAPIQDTPAMLTNWGIYYIVYCRHDTLPMRLSVDNSDGLWPRLYTDEIPVFLTRLSETNAPIQIYKLKEE